MSDVGERTEEATEKRMKDVHRKGQLGRSQDFTAWMGVGTAAVMIPLTLSLGADAATAQLLAIDSISVRPDTQGALDALSNGLGSLAATTTPLLVAVAVVVLVTAVVQNGVHIKKLTTFDQFNFVTGVGRVFGGQAMWGGVKALLKTSVVGLVLFAVVQGLMPVLMSAGGLSISALTAAATEGAGALLRFAVLAGLVLAVADVAMVMRRNRKKTRMTKKEVTDENKSSEGDPLIKSQRRSRQLAMSRNRMMAAIATSDVVIVNPTHIAIALKYEPGKSAPRVVAKGQGTVAARIRERAETERVPIVRDIPLARTLHSTCEIGQEIPAELYTSVARVLAFVMVLKRRGAASGVHTMAQVAA